MIAPNSNIDSSGLKTNESNGKQDQTNKDSTPVKMSDAEKAKSRAERFGVITTPNIDEKKSARAARFGITNTSKKIGKQFRHIPIITRKIIGLIANFAHR